MANRVKLFFRKREICILLQQLAKIAIYCSAPFGSARLSSVSSLVIWMRSSFRQTCLPLAVCTEYIAPIPNSQAVTTQINWRQQPETGRAFACCSRMWLHFIFRYRWAKIIGWYLRRCFEAARVACLHCMLMCSSSLLWMSFWWCDVMCCDAMRMTLHGQPQLLGLTSCNWYTLQESSILWSDCINLITLEEYRFGGRSCTIYFAYLLYSRDNINNCIFE